LQVFAGVTRGEAAEEVAFGMLAEGVHSCITRGVGNGEAGDLGGDDCIQIELEAYNSK
jgi:hypothetical protein